MRTQCSFLVVTIPPCDEPGGYVMSGPVLVTGAAGYVGAAVCHELLAGGRRVRGLDLLLHGQRGVAEELERSGVDLLVADLRDRDQLVAALAGAEAVVHLGAIVGDPACARDPALSQEINVDATRALISETERAGIQRMVFASTCSNYGRMADSSVPIDENAPLAPLSLYAEQKVVIERLLLANHHVALHPTCLRFATVYGIAPRMRFDLTVNEFTRDLWADQVLQVFGEQFWRPYIHVRDAARAVRSVLEAPLELVNRKVFNVGHSGENYRKMDLIEEIRRQISTGTVRYVSRQEDPRDYKVSFEWIRTVLGFQTRMTVADGIAELISALARGDFGNPFDPAYRNTP
jgi:nucleoside-diphosphate-sugar epimerase